MEQTRKVAFESIVLIERHKLGILNIDLPFVGANQMKRKILDTDGMTFWLFSSLGLVPCHFGLILPALTQNTPIAANLCTLVVSIWHY